MTKHILTYDKFLKENAIYETNIASSPGNFVKEAVKVLTDGGLTVEVLSSDRQLKNDNLSCKISFPKILDFIKEYYDFDFNTQVAYIEGNNLKQDVNDFSFNDIVFYSKGNMIRTSKSTNTEFVYSSFEEMVQETKVFLAKAFIKSSRSRGRILFPKRNTKKIFSFSSRSETPLTKSIQSRYSRNLPGGVKRILESTTPGFGKIYDMLFSLDQETCDMTTLMLCTLVEMHTFSKIKISKITPLSVTGVDSVASVVPFYDFSYSMTKNLLTKKEIFYIAEEVVAPLYRRSDAWFQDYIDTYLKLQALSQKDLDTYFEDFFHRRRGAIHGKKFNL